MNKRKCVLSVFLMALIFMGCNDSSNNSAKSNINISIPATRNDLIPSRFTCDGHDISLPLEWSGLAEGTKSVAIIADDPDAPVGTWVHWVIYNIPPDVNALGMNVPKERKLENGALQGRNDFGKIGYNGPCPPEGAHNYHFSIYALDKMLDLQPGANKEKLLDAMKGHVIGEGKVVAKYERRKQKK